MTIVTAGERRFDVDGVVFDKDGTLVDFGRLWGPRTARWLESLAALTGEPGLGAATGRAIGYDLDQQSVAGDGPLAVATTYEVVALVAGVLYQRGFGWVEANSLVWQAAETTVAAAPTSDEVLPVGRVAETIKGLTEAGIKIAIATNDDRALTEVILDHLGIAGAVSALVCGDDSLPAKPDAAVLGWIATELGSIPSRLLMVGDTVNDMLTGRNAGAAGCIGILNGAGQRESLAETADVVLASIDQLEY